MTTYIQDTATTPPFERDTCFNIDYAAALSKLSDVQREVWEMYETGYTVIEISEEFKTPLQTICSRVESAKEIIIATMF